MTSKMAPHHWTLDEVAQALERSLEGHARFERAYTLARGQFEERQSAIAAAVLTNGDALRVVRTEVSLMNTKLDQVQKTSDETQSALQSLDRWMRERFADADADKGRILAEFARLDNADAAAEQRDEKQNEEITSVHRRQEAARLALEAQQKAHAETVARIEADRARTTLKAGVATALPAALFSFLKEHPHAPEALWKAFLSLFGGHH